MEKKNPITLMYVLAALLHVTIWISIDSMDWCRLSLAHGPGAGMSFFFPKKKKNKYCKK